MKKGRFSILACGLALLAGLFALRPPEGGIRRREAAAPPGSPGPQIPGRPASAGGAAGWSGLELGAARLVVSRFFTALAAGRMEEARACLHPEADPRFFETLARSVRRLEIHAIQAPSLHPDGKSVFFPVLLRAVAGEGAPEGWETGIATRYVRLRLVHGEPRLAEIAEGP